MAHIGRLQNVWIEYENVKNTKEVATTCIPKISGYIKPVITTVKNESGYGVIDTVYDTQVVKEHSETPLKGIVTDKMFGKLALGALGNSAVTGAGPYTHNFTVKNDNNHPTFTIWGSNGVKAVSSTGCMQKELTLEAVIGEYVTYDVSFMGKKMVTESAPTVTYNCTETPFRARDVKVYFSDTEGSWGTAIPVTSLNMTITKNLYDHQVLGSDDIDTIHNMNFDVSGDMELLYEVDTYFGYVKAGTKKYTKIEMINTDVTLGGGGNPTITFILGKTAFETRDQTDDNNEIVKQTLGFTGTYNCTDGYTIKASMITSQSTDYDA